MISSCLAGFARQLRRAHEHTVQAKATTGAEMHASELTETDLSAPVTDEDGGGMEAHAPEDGDDADDPADVGVAFLSRGSTCACISSERWHLPACSPARCQIWREKQLVVPQEGQTRMLLAARTLRLRWRTCCSDCRSARRVTAVMRSQSASASSPPSQLAGGWCASVSQDDDDVAANISGTHMLLQFPAPWPVCLT